MNSIASTDTSVSAILSAQQLKRLHEDPPANPPPEFTKAIESAAEQAGLDASQIADLRKDIEEALQNVKPGDRDAAREAVAGVLDKHGIDADALKTKLAEMRQTLGVPSELLSESDSGSVLDAIKTLPTGSLINKSV